MKTLSLKTMFAITALILLSGIMHAQDTCAQLDFDCKVNLTTQRIANNPNDTEAYYDRGRAYSRQGKDDLAIADFSKYILLKPSKVEYLADGYTARADAYRKKGNMTLALADYNKAIAIAPNAASGYIGRGNAYVQQKNFPAALKDFNKAAAVGPDEVEVYYGRARAYQAQRSWDMAIADYNKYLSMKSGDDQYLADGYYSRGVCYFNKADYSQAINDYSKAIELHPTSAVYKDRAAAYRKLGKASLAAADEEQASQLLQQ